MATISSPGIGSGLDVNSIITQLVAIERQPVAALQTKATKIETQISEFGKQKSALSTLRDAALKLTATDFWGQTVGSSSNPAAVGVTTTSSAATGIYSVAVQSLAATQSLASGVYASSASTLGAGTLRIELGAWNTGQTSFTPKAGSTTIDIAVEATDTLAQIRDKINGAGAGVQAMVFTDAGGSRLMLRSAATGAENAFRTSVSATGTFPPLGGAVTGLAALNYDPSTPASTSMSRTQTAANAAATFNGLAVSSTSNTLANLVDGVTLTLGAVTTAPVDVSVVQDSASMKKSLQAFADAYNAVATLINTQTKYNAATKTGGPLQGDSAAVGLQRQLRSLAGTGAGASSTFARLADVGLGTDASGQMIVSSSKLDNALANPVELKKLLANTDLLVPANNGLARQFRTLADSMLSTDGSLTTRSDGLRQRLDQNKTQQERLNDRIAMTEKRLRAQYTALDTQLGKLNGLSSYVTQQIAQFNKSS
jgi:flagellar hook-associated protein 2